MSIERHHFYKIVFYRQSQKSILILLEPDCSGMLAQLWE